MKICRLIIPSAVAAVLLMAGESKWIVPFRSDIGAERVALRLDQMPDDARLELWNGGDIVALTADEIRMLVLSRNASGAKQGILPDCSGDAVCIAANQMAARYSAWTAIVNNVKPGTVDAREDGKWRLVEQSFEHLRRVRRGVTK